jgi:hypothetical protein
MNAEKWSLIPKNCVHRRNERRKMEFDSEKTVFIAGMNAEKWSSIPKNCVHRRNERRKMEFDSEKLYS